MTTLQWRSRRRPSYRWASGSKCDTIIQPAASSLVPNADAMSFPNFRGYRWSKVPKRCAGTKGEVRRAMAPVRWRNKCAVHFILTVLAEQCLSIGRSCTWGSVTRRRRGLLSQVCSDRWGSWPWQVACKPLAFNICAPYFYAATIFQLLPLQLLQLNFVELVFHFTWSWLTTSRRE